MRPRCLLPLAALFVVAGCNLNAELPPGPTLATGTPQDRATEAPLATASPTQDEPSALPTRTPRGFFDSTVPTLLPAGGFPATVPTSATGEYGQITSPAEGTSVPVGTLQVSGVVGGLRQDEFTLQLVQAGGQVINSQLITLNNPNQVSEVPWSAAMTTGSYTGPAEVRVLGRDAAGQDILLARVSITLVRGGQAPAPAQGSVTTPTGSITSPANNGVVAGGTIQVSGTAGGIPENQFVLALVAPDGTVVNSQIVTLTNTDYRTVVPWAASLGTDGYRGPAEIRAFTLSGASGGPMTIASARVTLE